MCISYKTAICMYMDSQTLFHCVLLHYTMHRNRHTEQGFYIKPTFAGATERGLFMQGKKLLSQKAETNAMLTLLLALLFCGSGEVLMWTALLGLSICFTQFLQHVSLFSCSLQCLSLFISCTHVRLGGVWESGRMTHLLHTSSSVDHIWASRKSIFYLFFLLMSGGEEQALQKQLDELFSYFLFSSALFSDQGPLIKVQRFLHDQNSSCIISQNALQCFIYSQNFKFSAQWFKQKLYKIIHSPAQSWKE